MKKFHNLIIVDESGSMSSIEKQAVSGMLETLNSIRSITGSGCISIYINSCVHIPYRIVFHNHCIIKLLPCVLISY